MAASRVYEPRRAADSTFDQVVRDYYETFRVSAESWREGAGMPRFIDEEFRGFLSCGWLAGGFARFRCDGCGLDRLVPFSCKGRVVCPSCGGRRMAERAAHLVDRVTSRYPPWTRCHRNGVFLGRVPAGVPSTSMWTWSGMKQYAITAMHLLPADRRSWTRTTSAASRVTKTRTRRCVQIVRKYR